MLCSQTELLVRATRAILETGGEGTILRKPNSQYLHGRSEFLYKFKVLSIFMFNFNVNFNCNNFK